MSLYHIHNSGKHVNKRQLIIVKSKQNKKKTCGGTEMTSFSCTVDDTHFESEVILCRSLCFSN